MINTPYVLIFILISAVLGLLIGLWKGARKKLAGIFAIITSVILSMLITRPLLKALVTDEMVNAIVDSLNFTAQYNELLAASPSAGELIRGIPIALVAPIVFLPIYGLLRLIFRIIGGVISKKIFKNCKWEKSRLIGMPLGFVQGTLTALVLVMIISGYASLANNVTDTVIAQESSTITKIKESVSEIDQYVNILADDPVVRILDKGNFLFNHINSFDFDNKKVVLNKEITSIADAGVNLLPLTEKTNIATWSDPEYEALEAFVEKFGNSKILPKVSSEVLSTACAKWAAGEKFMGIDAPKADDNINPLLVTLYASLRNSDSATIVADLDTLVDILKIVGKHQLLSSDTANILSKLNGTLISELLGVIATNDHFSSLIPEVTNLSIRLLASTIKLPANTGEVYNNITTSISSDVNSYLSSDKTEESQLQFKNSVTKSLQQNGIEVSDEVADIVAETLATAFAEKENVTQEDVENYFTDYAIVYSSVEGSQTNTASNDDSVKLEASTSDAAKTSSVYDYKAMSFDEKIAALSAIGLLDYYQTKYDLSAADSMLPNGMTADQFANYILAIYNGIVQNYEKVSELGASETNPVISLKSAETVQTSKTTAESLLVNTENYTLTDKDIENIAEGFDSITSFIDSVNKIEGSVSLENMSELDLEAVGKALDLLQDTDLLGDSVGDMADAIIGEMTGVDISISEAVNNGNGSFESLMTTVKSTSNVLGNLSNSDKTEEEKKEAILELLLNLTPETSDIISEIVTEDFMISFGIPTEYAYASTSAMKIALVEMAKLPEAEHDIEAARLQSLLTLVSSAGKSDKPLVGSNGMFKSEEEIIDMIVESGVVYKTIVSLSTDKNGNKISDALGFAKSMSASDKDSFGKTLINYYNENKTSTSVSDLADRLNAIAVLFDLGITVK